MSRPPSSVPNQWSALGAPRRFDGSMASGSCGARSGAAMAIRTNAADSARPIALRGLPNRRASCRRVCCRRPATAAIALVVMMLLSPAMSSPAGARRRPVGDARVEQDIGDVDEQIDENVDYGD